MEYTDDERQAMKLASWHIPAPLEGFGNWYPEAELAALGVDFGLDCKVSRFARIYTTRLKLGNHVRIDDFAILTGDIEIGSYVHIPPFSGLYGKCGIRMADFSGVSPACFVYSESDDYSGNSLMGPTVPAWTKKTRKGTVVFERHAVIGQGCTVLPGVTIAEGSIVGSHSLVKHDTTPWSMWGGTPARFLKERSRGLLEIERKLCATPSA